MTLILDADDLVGVLDYPTAIDAVEGAFRDLGSGRVVMPVRLTIRVEAHEGVSAFMPAYLPGKGPARNQGRLGLREEQGEIWPPDGYQSILLPDAKSGMPMAIVDGTYVT